MGLFNLLFGRMIDRRIAEYQNDLMQKHYDEVENIYRTMRGWRHDYHNHIQAMKALTARALETSDLSTVSAVDEANLPTASGPDAASLPTASAQPAASSNSCAGYLHQLDDYLDTLNQDLTTVDTVLKTGNIMVDAILNSKLSLIRSKNIAVNAKATVPSSLAISDVDLCALIGNLLDNAMEACLRQPENSERYIRVFIGILKGQLYLSVFNSAGENVRKSGKTYLSSKNSPTHGFGLARIDRITKKYGGYVNRQNEEGIFATEIMLPLQ